MQHEPHARARFLLDQAGMEGISLDEQRWLNSHTEECAECGQYAELSRRAIRALDSIAFDLDPVAALRVQNVIRSRAGRMASAESHGRRFSIGIAVAIVLTIIGSIAVWEPARWLAGRWNLPTPAWQIGFAMFWLLPSVLAGMLLLFPKNFIADHSGGEGQRI